VTRPLDGLPLVDLHVHLQGSVRPTTVAELAEHHGLDLPPALADGRYSFHDFNDFIAQYILTCVCLRTADDLRRAAIEFCADAATGGVRYSEITFTPQPHVETMGSWDAPVEAVLDGLATGRREYGVDSALVLDHVRGFDLDVAEQVLGVALRFADRGVVALGLGGDEANPPEPYADVFRRAKAEGLHSVPHAGEAAGSASIRGAIDALGAERIGHGIRILDDPALVADVAAARIPLEVCVTSNVALGIVADVSAHPLPALVDAGLQITLNSDDPAMFGSYLRGEYELARSVFGYDDQQLAQFARAAVDGAFIASTERADLHARIDAWLASTPISP